MDESENIVHLFVQPQMHTLSVTLLQATFTYPLAGAIYFKQVGDEEVAVWGKLYWVSGADRTGNQTWSITQTAVSWSLPISVVISCPIIIIVATQSLL